MAPDQVAQALNLMNLLAKDEVKTSFENRPLLHRHVFDEFAFRPHGGATDPAWEAIVAREAALAWRHTPAAHSIGQF